MPVVTASSQSDTIWSLPALLPGPLSYTVFPLPRPCSKRIRGLSSAGTATVDEWPSLRRLNKRGREEPVGSLHGAQHHVDVTVGARRSEREDGWPPLTEYARRSGREDERGPHYSPSGEVGGPNHAGKCLADMGGQSPNDACHSKQTCTPLRASGEGGAVGVSGAHLDGGGWGTDSPTTGDPAESTLDTCCRHRTVPNRK